MWRNATTDDLAAIDQIVREIHPGLTERPEIFAEKFRLFPDGCFVFAIHGATAGYGIAHPWRLNDIPPLDTFLGGLPDPAECIYIHDVALLPEARGHGAAADYVERIVKIARDSGLAHLALVSVYATYPLWERLDFRMVRDATSNAKLASYGSDARYMVRHV